MSAAELFARHLDLAPLRGRHRGLVRCRFHDDRGPSLSIDLDRGLFNCFGCGARGGIKRFAELVGEHVASREPVPGESEGDRAWREVLARERVLAARRAEWAPVHAASHHIRHCHRTVAEARALATTLGEQHERFLVLLELAVQVERKAWALETELDAILAEGRIS